MGGYEFVRPVTVDGEACELRRSEQREDGTHEYLVVRRPGCVAVLPTGAQWRGDEIVSPLTWETDDLLTLPSGS